MNYLVKSTDFGQLERVESPQSFERMIRLNIKNDLGPRRSINFSGIQIMHCCVINLILTQR